MGGSMTVALAVALQALSNGLLSDNLSSVESVLLSLIAFSTSAVVFGVVARFRSGGGGRTAIRGPRLRLMVALNVATAVTFLGFYWSLSAIPAPVASTVETGIGPLAVACLRYRSCPPVRRSAEVGLGLLALLLALSVGSRMISTGQVTSPALLLCGAGVAATAGCSAAAIAALSHRLGQLSVTPVQVTAHRFHLTYVIAAVVLVFAGHPAGGWVASRVAFIATIAVLGAALPLFVLQIGMQRTPPLTVTLIASSVPDLTYLMATLTGKQSFDILTFALINASLAVAFLGPVLTRRLSSTDTPTRRLPPERLEVGRPALTTKSSA